MTNLAFAWWDLEEEGGSVLSPFFTVWKSHLFELQRPVFLATLCEGFWDLQSKTVICPNLCFSNSLLQFHSR